MHWNAWVATDAVGPSDELTSWVLPTAEINVADGSSVVSVHIPSGWLRRLPPSPPLVQPGTATFATPPRPMSEETTPTCRFVTVPGGAHCAVVIKLGSCVARVVCQPAIAGPS